MKKTELFFSFLLVPLDYLMIVLAALTAYYIRFSDFTTEIRAANFNIDIYQYLRVVLLIALSWIIVFALAGLYNIKGVRNLVKEFYRVTLACSTGFMLVVLLIFIQRELFDSRFIILAAWIISIFYIFISRAVIRFLQQYIYKYGIGVHKVILVGDSKTADYLMREFSSNKNSGFEVVKRFHNFNMETSIEFEDFLKINDVDEVIQCDPNLSKTEMIRLFDFTDERHIGFKFAADLLGAKVLQTEIREMWGVPIVEVKKTPLDGWGRIVKRIFDLIGSSFLIIIISPVLLITSIVIKIDSKGPVFFSKKDDGAPLFRVGQGGKLFQYSKFRSMRPNVDSLRYTELANKNMRGDGPMVKIKNDPRVTKVGRFIRRWSIDELPELFLVFKGSMSLVGPRPHLPEEVAKYEHHHKKLLTIKPGITGMAQISGRSDLLFEDEVKLDVYYIENWSLLMDLSILLRTPMAIFRSRDTE